MNKPPTNGTTATGQEIVLARTDEKFSNEEFARTIEKMTPTQAVFHVLQFGYSYYNSVLYDDELPECMLTLHERKSRSLGYYRPDGFVSADGTIVDQISINPEFMLDVDPRGVLATLVHEMEHLRTSHFGHKEAGKRKNTNGYHCKKWASGMERVGLIPSDTGEPGGKKTGYQVSHYIAEGGPFDLATNALLDNGFAITWGLARNRQDDPNGSDSGSGSDDDSEDDERKKRERSKGKVKFQCPTCDKPCWAAPTRKLICGDDKSALVPVY